VSGKAAEPDRCGNTHLDEWWDKILLGLVHICDLNNIVNCFPAAFANSVNIIFCVGIRIVCGSKSGMQASARFSNSLEHQPDVPQLLFLLGRRHRRLLVRTQVVPIAAKKVVLFD
jgi:hypothetical protein